MKNKTKEAPPSALIMNFAHLMLTKPQRSGTCRFCKKQVERGCYYSIRHLACLSCCLDRKDEKLPSVIAHERKAARIVRRVLEEGRKPHPGVLRAIAGVSIQYAEWLIAEMTR